MALADIPDDFGKIFSAWVRLEGRARSDDFTGGIEARTADPLWLLARQWQTGELTGDDAASPIEVSLDYATQTPDRIRLGESTEIVDLPDMPLETLVEQEQSVLTWRDRIQLGRQIEKIAHSVLKNDAPVFIQACRLQFPLTIPSREHWVELDRASRRMLKLALGRVADGKLLLEGLKNNSIAVPEGITETQLAAVKEKFAEYCLRLNISDSVGKPPAWRNQQLDYRFEINPPEENVANAKTHLIAPSYRNGSLDWYSFNIAASNGGWNDQETIKTIPAPVSISGTSPRWWEFEDGAVNFGKLDITKTDLARMLLMEFVLIYGDDWFSVPLPVNIPNLVKINRLSVRNVFGEVLDIDPAQKSDPDPLLRFEMFSLSPVADTNQPGVCDTCLPGESRFLFLPPMTGYREESAAQEEIRFLRDEGANKVWGVEHIVQNGLGRPVNGFDAQRERIERRKEEELYHLEKTLIEIQQELLLTNLTVENRRELEHIEALTLQRLAILRDEKIEETSSVPRFRLASTVPENWIPFAPIDASLYLGYPGIRLRRAQMLRNVDDEEPTPIPAMSRLLDLEEEPLLWLEETSVPRTGLRVQLTHQRMRWTNGKTYVWTGRKVTTGLGEGSSGLRFDFTDHPANEAAE